MHRFLCALGLLLLVVTPACGDDSRPRGDGSVTTDSGRSDSRVGDSAVSDSTTRDSGGGDYNYCPGFDPRPASDCRVDTDCECGSCTVGSICGGVGCASECGSDADCTDGWCATGCCSYCVPSCPGVSCAEGQRCDTDTGRCNPIPCDDPEGTACGTNYRCVSGGCLRLECTADADCDCGTCAGGRCYDRPGQCCPALPG